jgi:hypothetical protein
MKKLVLMFAILGITTSSFARLIIRQECCDKACTDKCWVVMVCGHKTPCPEKEGLLITSGQVIGNKLVLNFNAAGIEKAELEKLLKGGISFQGLTDLTPEELSENKIKGSKKGFTILDSKAVPVVTKKASRKGGPEVTITLTIKFGK